MRFDYEGYDRSGALVSGTVEALSRRAALATLEGSNILVRKLEIAANDQAVNTSFSFAVSNRVSLNDLEFLTAELSLLLDGGVRIDRAIRMLSGSGKSRAVSHLLARISSSLKQGKQLSDCLAEHPDVFDSLYINLVRLGEAGGKLPAVFRELAKDLAFRKDLKQKIISAAVYPMVVLMVCVLSVVFILNFVVPSLEGLFADASNIPWYTELLLDTSRFFRQWQWALGFALMLTAALVWRYRRSPSLIDQREKLLISTPGLRDALLMVERIRFAGGLSMMLEAGMPIDRALGLSADNVGNSIIRKQLKSAIAFVKRGEQVSSSLRKTKLFPDYFASLLEVGEETGQLASSLSNIAERTRSEFAAWALRLTTLLEPLLILVMGLIVGGVVVIMMLSITSIGDVGL